MKYYLRFTALSFACFAFASYANQAANQAKKNTLTEIIVTAELLERSELELPNSVSVIDAKLIKERTARHLEDVLNLAPNVNFATGASRGRFIQIRGIGERSEFQEPIINSVGVLIDGIDFTGIATAASALDVQQIEILRGPQGTLHGANALAGLINVVSNKPTDEFYGEVTTAVEDFGGFELGGVVSGALTEDTGYRLAIKHYESDGFTENVFLGRDNTNNIDETTARLRINSALSDKANLDFTLFGADIDNGYDAFSLDNTRQTFSDQPGVDKQDTIAASLKLDYLISETLSLEALASFADSELEYSFDEDWSHVGICEGTPCDSDILGFDLFYSSFDDYRRDNDNLTLDVRLLNQVSENSAWVVGLYHRDQNIDLFRQYTFADADFNSRFDTLNTAIYGQVDFGLTKSLSLSTGIRYERREADYSDNTGINESPEESLWGGRIALEYRARDDRFYYALISRGYKAGGFNLEQDIPDDRREFDTETMVNYELGFKHQYLDGRLSLQTALFYQTRDDIQSKQSIVSSIETGEVGGPCPCNFSDFTSNASSGNNYGVEVELNWQANEQLNLYLTAGLLETEFDEFLSFEHVNADQDNGTPFNLDGREQAHAPSYQFVIGGSWFINENWQVSGSVEAKDDFLFSDRHEERSDAYELLNLEIAYHAENWNLAIYGKNLTDELVKTRGFGSFGNDPRNSYEIEPYNQFGAPRVVGLKARLEF